jgi:hypothetical protein
VGRQGLQRRRPAAAVNAVKPDLEQLLRERQDQLGSLRARPRYDWLHRVDWIGAALIGGAVLIAIMAVTLSP